MTNREKFEKIFGISEPPNDEWWQSDFNKIKKNNVGEKNKCGDCKYLDLSEKTTVGYVCNRPNHRWLTSTSHLKYKWSIACKAFEKRTE